MAGCTYTKLLTSKTTITDDEIFTDNLGDCGSYVFVKQNPFFNDVLQREENETHTGIQYGRGERLLPKELFKALVTCLTNKCSPARKSALV